MSTTTHSEQVVNHQSKSSKAQARLAWILISPTVLVLTIVILIPIAQSLYQSLFGRPRLEDDGFFSTTEPFVGLKNSPSTTRPSSAWSPCSWRPSWAWPWRSSCTRR